MKRKENNIKNEKNRMVIQYIIMTSIISIILFILVMGIMFISSEIKVKAMEKQNKIEVQTENFEHVEPTFISVKTDNKESEIINLGKYRLTAYCSCEKCCGKYGRNRPKDKDGNDIVYTASGKIAQAGYTVAADPSILPYGTIIYINGKKFEVQDCGGSIKGNKVDIYFDNHEDACKFGVQYADVFMEK